MFENLWEMTEIKGSGSREIWKNKWENFVTVDWLNIEDFLGISAWLTTVDVNFMVCNEKFMKFAAKVD